MKLSHEKIEKFEKLVSILLGAGCDMYINRDKDEVNIYPPNDNEWSLNLRANGTWRLE